MAERWTSSGGKVIVVNTLTTEIEMRWRSRIDHVLSMAAMHERFHPELVPAVRRLRVGAE